MSSIIQSTTAMLRVGSCPLIGLALVGCTENRPAPIPVVTWDAGKITSAAFEQLDSNRNEILEESELSPGLVAALPTTDVNKDRSLSKAELEGRLKSHLGLGAGLQSTAGILTLKGQPVSGIKVTLRPEDFMASVCKPAVGITDESGTFTLKTAEAPLPGALPGIYRVTLEPINTPNAIPEKYTKETTLGFEVAGDLPSQLMLNLEP